MAKVHPECESCNCAELAPYELRLTAYEAANLMQLVDAIYRFPAEPTHYRVSQATPVRNFNSGDWIGQLYWKLKAEVGDEYPVPPNPVNEGRW